MMAKLPGARRDSRPSFRRAAESGAGAHCYRAGGRDARMPAGAGATGGYAAPPERRKKCVWRRGLFHRQGLLHEAVPVRKGVPAGGDIAAAGGSRWVVAGRLSLGRRLLCGGLDG